MRKLIAAINMTVDGFCDHTHGIPDDEIHDHYTELLRSAGAILYGRITYRLMEYWLTVLKNPTGTKFMDEFAVAIDRIPKIVFSNTMKDIGWETARLAARSLPEEVIDLKQQAGKDIFVGSPSLIVQAMNLNLVDECQLCIHPVIAGQGLSLFKHINEKTNLKLLRTKTFRGGAVILYYEPVKTKTT